ncbi:hypothetical protein L5G28_02365 [Gordonia sp. HY285]|uniref:hypothetical protein n=1 Tax=Gordonia liuliyuniae TaxID=2911517 RepID=UPI001F1AD949|nr:hypothetical protein [Gordonia liuliyuniae]MCF8609011.1 hypothetical protein [Gordonia liuliyuniae]
MNNHPRTARRAAALAAGAGTLAFTAAVLAAGFGGSGDAHADALCDQMRAQYGPSWPCVSVPTYTPPPTMPTQPTTPNAPGAPSGNGPVIGGDAGPGPGQGNGTPIIGGAETSSRPNNTQAPEVPTTQAPGTTTLSPTFGQRAQPGQRNVEERPDRTSAPADTPVGNPAPGTATDKALLNPLTDGELTIPLPVWAIGRCRRDRRSEPTEPLTAKAGWFYAGDCWSVADGVDAR